MGLIEPFAVRSSALYLMEYYNWDKFVDVYGVKITDLAKRELQNMIDTYKYKVDESFYPYLEKAILFHCLIMAENSPATLTDIEK